MATYPCPYCSTPFSTFAGARAHLCRCPRLQALGGDLESAVLAGRMTIEAAEAEQAARPKLRL